MFHIKKKCTLVFTLFLFVAGLKAGDVATFVDLGFSSDGKVYMFAQYGVQARTLRPWSELFIVDVANNNFVSGGRFSFVGDRPVVFGQDGSETLFRLIAESAALAEKHGIGNRLQGQPLFIAVDRLARSEAVRYAPIEFRNFDAGITYRASLISQIEGSGNNLRSSFFINLEKTTRDGTRKTYTVGTPQFRRPLISSYRIRKVLMDPSDESMIFVIEMKRPAGRGFDIRYMVEAVRL